MDSKQNTSLQFRTKYEVIEKVNEEFTRVKIYVCSYGKNRNFTYISYDSLQQALPTLAYCPVVAHLYRKENGSYIIGGHDMDVIVDDDGINLKSLTVPFGVVISDTFRFETVEEFGDEKDYLVAEAYIWSKRYPELMETIYSDDCWWNQSMEINFDDYRPYNNDSNYTELLGINFSALCLLNKSDDKDEEVKPCFINAKVEPIKFALDSEFLHIFDEMKQKLAFSLENKEGGNGSLTEETIKKILDEYSLTLENIDFEIEDSISEEDFRQKLEDYKQRSNEGNANPEENLETLKASLEDANSRIIEITNQFEEYKNCHSVEDNEVNQLKAFKEEVLQERRKKEEENLFIKFDEKLNGDTEYEALKANCQELSLGDISDKCFSILGRKLANFSLEKPKKPGVKVPVVNNETQDDDKPYGDTFEKYRNK